MDRRLWSLAGAAVAVALLGLVSLQSHQVGALQCRSVIYAAPGVVMRSVLFLRT